MSTKTYANNPTANLFELLQVDSDLPEKRAPNKAQAGGKKPAESGPTLETPAEKGQRRKAAEAQKQAAAAAEKQRRETEEAMAALIPQEGFQVQKGSATKKPTEAKPKAMKREDFETQEKPQGENKPKQQFRGPGNPKKFEGTGKPDGAKQYQNADKRQNNPSNRPPRHEGYDKHSGGKTTNKPPAKRKGDGTGNWGNDTSPTTGGWAENVVTTPSASDGTGWGDEGDKKVDAAPASQGWGDEGDKKPEKSEKDTKEGEKDEKERKPAWDEVEGHGKMLLDQFQATVAAERAQKLADLKVGVKGPGRQIESTVDLSKCSYRDTTDEKEKKLAEERKRQLEEERKKKGQQRAGEKNVDLSAFIDVRTRGGGRGGRGGRGGGRGSEGGSPTQERVEQQPAENRPNRGGRGGRGGGGGGNRVPLSKNAFPDLPAPSVAPAAQTKAPVVATPPATGSPKSTK